MLKRFRHHSPRGDCVDDGRPNCVLGVGNRIQKTVFQGFGLEGSAATAHWTQPTSRDRGLNRAIGWTTRVRCERIGQVAELRQLVFHNNMARHNLSHYLKIGIEELVPFWQKIFREDLLMITVRDSDSGLNCSDLIESGWSILSTGDDIGNPASCAHRIWFQETIPGALTILKSPLTPAQKREKRGSSQSGPFLAITLSELNRAVKLLSSVMPDPRTRNSRPSGIGPLLTFIGLARWCGHANAQTQLHWLGGLDDSLQEALGFKRRDHYGNLRQPTLAEIKKFSNIMKQAAGANERVTGCFNAWLEGQGLRGLDHNIFL